jgi:RNA polymerase sigma-70 factor (ECF subfamily)
MKPFLNERFVEEINQHLGIAHKISAVYARTPEEKEDLFQEMMYQLCRAYPNFRQEAKFSTWMYRVCLNTALNQLRNYKRLPQEPLDNYHRSVMADPADPAAENIEKLYQAIATLSAVNKAVILLYLEELSYQEIADITGLSKSNISVKLVRIKKELEKRMKTSTSK